MIQAICEGDELLQNGRNGQNYVLNKRLSLRHSPGWGNS